MRIDFFKEGKGVSPNEPEKSRFAKFFIIYAMRFWKLISLNALYLLLCLPVVTAGPSTVAMAYVLRRYSEEKLTYVWADFWAIFRSCFGKGLLYSVCYAAAAGIVGFSVYFYFVQALHEPWFFALFAIGLIVLLMVLVSGLYAVMLIGSVEITLWQTIKNSLILSIAAMKRNLLVLLAWLVGAACIVLLFPASLLLVLLFMRSRCGTSPYTYWIP